MAIFLRHMLDSLMVDNITNLKILTVLFVVIQCEKLDRKQPSHSLLFGYTPFLSFCCVFLTFAHFLENFNTRFQPKTVTSQELSFNTIHF